MKYLPFKMLVVIATTVVIVGCQTKGPTKPALDQLSLVKEQYFIKDFKVTFLKKQESKTFLPKIMSALNSIKGLPKPTGRPAIMNIHITKFHDMGAGQSLLIGGSNHLEYTVKIVDEATGSLKYQIDLKNTAGYAPGGIFGVLAELGSDTELDFAKSMTKRIETTVLKANDIPVLTK